MKRICLLRHAESESKSPTGEDKDRNLTQSGKNSLKTKASKLKMNGFHTFDRILCSPAHRAVQTVEIIFELMRIPAPEITKEDRIFQNEARLLRKVIGEQNDEHETILIVGHNPSLQSLPTGWTEKGSLTFFPATFAAIEFPVESWSEVGVNGTLLYMDL